MNFSNILGSVIKAFKPENTMKTEFKRVTRRFSRSEITNLESQTLYDTLVINRCRKALKIMEKDVLSGDHLRMGFNSGRAVVNLGKPNVTLPGLESNPGVWIFEHTSGVILLVFSDGHRKNCYRGTSYELVNVPDNFDDIMALSVYNDIKDLIKCGD